MAPAMPIDTRAWERGGRAAPKTILYRSHKTHVTYNLISRKFMTMESIFIRNYKVYTLKRLDFPLLYRHNYDDKGGKYGIPY
ncbi:MAG: hypothetical protein KKD44_10645, partial [Proteobacteria bacterium]|nr:hypothetical protein [Pseudomonadota bacterium]